MSTPFLGEMRVFSFNFAPKGWALCNGQLLQINTNQALFALLGTTYGGDGRTTFALPNLQGRRPIHVGAGIIQGQAGGEDSHTLIVSQMPTHIHQMSALPAASPALAAGRQPGSTKVLAEAHAVTGTSSTTPVSIYGVAAPSLALAGATITNVGGGQGHENRPPFLTLNISIALQGIFPSRN